MKKKFILLFILILLYFIIQIMLNIFGNKHNLNYTLNINKERFNIIEEYNKNIKDSYYINIIHNDKVYSYQWNEKSMGKKIIKDIKYYQDEEIECILPVFNDNKVIFDVTCHNGNNIEYYHNMTNISDGLINFIDSINSIYSSDNFKDNNSNIVKTDLIDISLHNLQKNKIVSIETYKGIINIGNSKNDYEKIKIFEKDKYKKDISGYTKDYYIVADYDQTYEFNKFYIVNLKTNVLKELKLNYHISFDSYIQGIDDNIVYLFDEENKYQYKIDCKKMIVEEIGNINNIKIYKDGNWLEEKVSNLLKNKVYFDFSNIKKEISGNKEFVTINNYIYTFENNGDTTLLYKSNMFSPNIKNYLFTINDTKSLMYIDDYIYFKKDNYIGYYNEKIGLKKIIKSNELFFNNNILYTIIEF